MPGGSTTGSSRSRTTEDPSSDTVPPRVRSRSSAEPEWTGDSCRRSLTRRRRSTDSACRGRTFPSSVRLRSPQPVRTTFSCSCPICSSEVRRTFPEVEAAGGDGWTRKHCADARAERGAAPGATPSDVPRCRGESDRRLPRDGSLHVGQDLSQVVEAASPRRPDAADRHAQLFGDLLVGKIVVTHQQAEETLAARRQLLRRHSYRSLLLASEEACVERVRLVVRHEVHEVVRWRRRPGGWRSSGSRAARWSPARRRAVPAVRSDRGSPRDAARSFGTLPRRLHHSTGTAWRSPPPTRRSGR